ncbi:hypothetical protein QQF64_020278 [Cirrhinus molitorella]|uniref:TRIM8/14/16/25/29/45/65 coiled-coil region domain-containing protein n=1 Tax=Cirrhinus molitorella TaxID=172907 RepID=A0ABR3LCM1_9TELE
MVLGPGSPSGRSPFEIPLRRDLLSQAGGDHRTHNTVPIEEESQQKKNQLVQTQTGVQQMMQERMKKIQEIQHSVEMRKRCQSELLLLMEEQQKATEKQAEDLIKELQQEITDLRSRNYELEQLSHTDDHLHLIQVSPAPRDNTLLSKPAAPSRPLGDRGLRRGCHVSLTYLPGIEGSLLSGSSPVGGWEGDPAYLALRRIAMFGLRTIPSTWIVSGPPRDGRSLSVYETHHISLCSHRVGSTAFVIRTIS